MEGEILQLTEELMKAKDELAIISAEKTRLEDIKKKLEYKLYYAMEDQDITSFKHDIYGTIYRSHRVWCKVIDTEKAYKFFKEKGVYDEITRLEVRTGRLNTLIKTEFLDAKGVIPETEIGISATLTPMIGNRASKTGGDIVQETESEGL